MPVDNVDNEALIAMMPFAVELGIALGEASPERVVATLPWAPRLCTTAGVMHGGVLMSLADTVGATSGTVRAGAVLQSAQPGSSSPAGSSAPAPPQQPQRR
jgi:acyl-coenzyme A thioesterase PaaI-like protein